MEKKKIDRIIDIVRESMSVGSNGFTGSADPKGPTAGFDPTMDMPVKRRKRQYMSGGTGMRKRWLDYLKNK